MRHIKSKCTRYSLTNWLIEGQKEKERERKRERQRTITSVAIFTLSWRTGHDVDMLTTWTKVTGRKRKAGQKHYSLSLSISTYSLR
jgi:hypothetical protein